MKNNKNKDKENKNIIKNLLKNYTNNIEIIDINELYDENQFYGYDVSVLYKNNPLNIRINKDGEILVQ